MKMRKGVPPRPRGLPSSPNSQVAEPPGSPAPAGIAPPSNQSATRAFGFPRARGDCPFWDYRIFRLN